MHTGTLPIYWNCVIIGTIENPFYDMFNVSGKWTPSLGLLYDSFLEQIRNSGEAIVHIGNVSSQLTGYIDEVPSEEIAISFNIR